jgi:hypothetical protein
MWSTLMPESAAPVFSFATARIALPVSVRASSSAQQQRHHEGSDEGDQLGHGQEQVADLDHRKAIGHVDRARVGAEASEQGVLYDDRQAERHQQDVAVIAVAGRVDDEALHAVAQAQRTAASGQTRPHKDQALNTLCSDQHSEHRRRQRRAMGEVDDVQHAVDQASGPARSTHRQPPS